MAYLCLGIGPTKKQQAFIYVKIHILRVHFLGTSLMGTGDKTSVPNAENGPSGRKSASTHGVELPSQTVKTGFKDGSQRLRWKVKERSPHRGADSYAIIKTVSVRHLR